MIITNPPSLIPARHGAAGPLTFQATPKPLIYIPDGWALVFWAAAVLVLLAAAYFFWRWWRKKRATLAMPLLIPAHVRARRKLEEALAMIGDAKPFSILVSGAIREYLEERFDFRAPDRTTEEFLCELQSSRVLTVEQKESLGGFLASCDLIKFARYEPTEMELRGLHDSALRLVNETEPRLVPETLQSSVRQWPAEEAGVAMATAESDNPKANPEVE